MLVEGTEYTVTWDGVEYTCLARLDNYDDVYIGSQSVAKSFNAPDDLFTEVIESSEPFFIMTYAPDNRSMIMANAGSYTISIKMSYEEVHKIDKKYLPEISSIKNILDGSAEGSVRTTGANAELGEYAFAEGYNTTASGHYSHAEGEQTTASVDGSHAEGYNTRAFGYYSHAEGWNTEASGKYSHAEGWCTIASSQYQHVHGKFNIKDVENEYAHIVGNGTTYSDRKNAHTLDWNGNAWFAGNVYVGGTSQDDENAVEVATKTDLDSYEFITVEDIDEICNAVTEGSLESTDVDELMNKLQ